MPKLGTFTGKKDHFLYQSPSDLAPYANAGSVPTITMSKATAIVINRNTPMNGNTFFYRDETNEIFKFSTSNMVQRDPDESEAQFCHFHKAQDYKCIYSSRSALRHLGLHPRWFSKCSSCDKLFHVDCFVLFAKSQPSLAVVDGCTKTACGKDYLKGLLKGSVTTATS